MMYGSWDIKCKGQRFLPLWAIFCPLTLLTSKFWNKKNSCRHYHFTLVYHKWQSYDVWFLRYQAWLISTDIRHNFCHFGLFFALLPSNPENQIFEKMKKTLGDIIILPMSTTNQNHMYGSWDIKHNRHNFLSSWASFFNQKLWS